jgi:hypothetical protein
MSRTDKDKPWQLRAADGQDGSYIRHVCGGRVPCDIDVDPYDFWKNAYNRTSPDARHYRVWKAPSCGPTVPYAYFVHPPHWYVRHVWTGPERVRERAQLGEMVKEYNAGGDLADGDFANYQHHHGAHWSWW